jgi:CubicO group peptidase (beta-lactamase class C family)
MGIFRRQLACLALTSLPWIAQGADLAISLTEIVNRFASQHGLSGTLGVQSPERSFEMGVGSADDGRHQACGPETLYLIASNSKQFAAAAILKLEEEGKLSVDDEVSLFFPEYPKENLASDGKAATLRHLLQHVSGIPNAYGDEQIARALFQRPIEFKELLDAIKNRPLQFRPESKWEYSNTGYILLGEVVRRRSGMSYGDYLRSRFWHPLGLSHTSIGFPQEHDSKPAKSYISTAAGREDFVLASGIKEPHVSDVFVDGNIFTSVGDLGKWLLALTSGRVLSAASTKSMFSPSAVKPYGFGWILGRDAKGRTRYAHWGYWLGYMSFIVIYPQEQVAVVWLGNQLMSEEVSSAFYDEVVAAALP